MNKAVLLVTFNRLDYLKEVFEKVKEAKPPRIYLASDGARPEKEGEKEKVEEVRNYMLSNIDWDCEVKTRFLETNSGGCCNGVSGAISWFFENEKDGIILEDDCLPDISFFSFCEELLDKYNDNKQVWTITGFSPVKTDIESSYYFSKIPLCWGWATWADRWKHFDKDLTKFKEEDFKKFSTNKNVIEYWKRIWIQIINNKIDTWGYRWAFNVVQHNGYCLTSSKSIVSNIGVDGVHYENSVDDPNLNHKLESLNKIIHPDSITYNDILINKIYSESFGIDLKTHYIKNFIEFIFSVKNDYNYSKGIKRKLLTILGIKIYLKKEKDIYK